MLLYNEILDRIDDFFLALSNVNVNCKSLEDLQKEHYCSLLELVGFENRSLMEDALLIQAIGNAEEKDLQLDAFLEKYPENGFGLFLRASIAFDRKEFRKAKKYYEDLFGIEQERR